MAPAWSSRASCDPTRCRARRPPWPTSWDCATCPSRSTTCRRLSIGQLPRATDWSVASASTRALGGWPTSGGQKGSSSRWPSASAEPRNARICRGQGEDPSVKYRWRSNSATFGAESSEQDHASGPCSAGNRPERTIKLLNGQRHAGPEWTRGLAVSHTRSRLRLPGGRVYVIEELRKKGVADPLLVLVGRPCAAVHEQEPGIRMTEGPQDVCRGGGVDARGKGSELVEALGEAAEDSSELCLDPLPEVADRGIGDRGMADDPHHVAGPVLCLA